VTRQRIIAEIARVLEEEMNVKRGVTLSETTHLNRELWLDSVMVLELLLHLELKLGLVIPEHAPSEESFATVGGLASFLLGIEAGKREKSAEIGEVVA
jgi:acyl carrier protein